MKDLYASRLPLGGEKAVGRGRFEGQRFKLNTPQNKFEFVQSPQELSIEKRNVLQGYIDKFIEKVSKGEIDA